MWNLNIELMVFRSDSPSRQHSGCMLIFTSEFGRRLEIKTEREVTVISDQCEWRLVSLECYRNNGPTHPHNPHELCYSDDKRFWGRKVAAYDVTKLLKGQVGGNSDTQEVTRGYRVDVAWSRFKNESCESLLRSASICFHVPTFHCWHSFQCNSAHLCIIQHIIVHFCLSRPVCQSQVFFNCVDQESSFKFSKLVLLFIFSNLFCVYDEIFFCIYWYHFIICISHLSFCAQAPPSPSTVRAPRAR